MTNSGFLSYSQQVSVRTHKLSPMSTDFFSSMLLFNLLGAEASYSTICCQELIQ